MNDARLGIRVSNEMLHRIIEELYFPQSPYTFSVVETEVLGSIYEQFLGEVISIEDGNVEIVQKPEVRAAGGVVPTPQYIADIIVARTLVPALGSQTPYDLAEVTKFTVADICCGSGVFLLAAYEALLDHCLAWYLSQDRTAYVGKTIFEAAEGRWHLTFEERRRILLVHICGVDIDPNAANVTQLGLLLKLIESESSASLKEYIERHHSPALPDLGSIIRCGNSLVSEPEWKQACGELPDKLVAKINPMTWATEFPTEAKHGFHVIVGNPPYVRIQHMAQYSPEEVAFYQEEDSPYATAQQDNFDKYALFIERALGLLGSRGRLGFIVPHKFMTIQSGRTLRELIAADASLAEIVHFGVRQVFGAGKSNYTCILIFDKNLKSKRRPQNLKLAEAMSPKQAAATSNVRVEKPGPLDEWRYGKAGTVTRVPAAELTEEPWAFADVETQALFARVRARCPSTLGTAAEIFVGVQTSADAIYIFRPAAESADTLALRWNNQDWNIERGILRPCLYDVPLFAFARPQANAWMIFPYEFVQVKHRAHARLIQPDAMATQFPGCWAYLKARSGELEKRNVTGGPSGERQWYQFGRSQSLVKFNTAKIILPALSLEPRYAYDDANIIVTGGGNGPYYMVRPKAGSALSNEYLLAILNHPLSEAMVRTRTSPFRGGYYSHGRQFIQHLPVPDAAGADRAAIEDLVRRLIQEIGAIPQAATPHQQTLGERRAANLRAQIQARVDALFGLVQNDHDIISAVPVPE